MDQTGLSLLNLMFRPGETICVSHNKYGYHSIPLEAVQAETVVLVPTPESCEKRGLEWGPDYFEHIPSNNLLLAALNPINGYREDANCTAFRNFLVEVDTGPLDQQLAYIEALGLPYSACVFSGNKSLHFLISLDKDLPSENVWRTLAEWTLNIATMADQQTKNPSRSIRLPGAYREPGKKQRIVRMRGPTSLAEFSKWLAQYPSCKPLPPEKTVKHEGPIDLTNIFSRMKPWIAKKLKDGIHSDRNKWWYAIACEFVLAGIEEDDTIMFLGRFFTPDRDFKEKEWKITIKSAFKHMSGKL